MRWHDAHVLSLADLLNLACGRMIEDVIVDAKVPAPEGGDIVFPLAFKLFGVHAYVGFFGDQPYILRYWIPV